MKKSLLLLAFFWAFFIQNVAAQCPGSMNFYEQKLIDDFSTNYPGCKNIVGPVGIFGTDITNLNGLLGLETVGDDFSIHDTNLKNLQGLDSLKMVGGVLYFQKNQQLESFAGLENVHFLKTGLIIEGSSNPKLKNFHGLDGLERIESFFDLYFGNIESFHGLENLRFVGQSIQILGTKIEDFSGLEKLDSIGIHLALQNMKRLKSLSGLKKLRYASPNFTGCDSLLNLHGLEALESGLGIYIIDNQRLTSLDGLENFAKMSDLTNTWGDLYLSANPMLDDLSALDHPLKMSSLFLKNNPNLAICNIQSICEYLAAPGDTTVVSGNLPSCGSAGEILSFCTSATNGFSEKTAFEISPNPISDGQPLQILLENDFLGNVKIEFLSLDGRLFSVFSREKTARQQVFEIADLPAANTFFIKILHEKGTETRLVFKK
jgi:hypothetical protein